MPLQCIRPAVAAGILLMLVSPVVRAQSVYQSTTGTSSWNTATNWNPAAVPSGTGVSVTFNGAATASNPVQTANRTVNLDGARTVGSILFNTDLSTFTNSIVTGSGGPLTFDETGAGPATITTTGAGTGNNTISVAMVLTDSLVASVNNTTATSAAGSLNLTAAISGPGGFTKQGDGLATFGTGAKIYTGATVLSGGRTRISQAAQPSATSSFTVNAGAQLTLIATSGNFTFGSGPLNLNGVGATSGPSAAFPGAVRNDTNFVATINNAVVLQSDTLLHVEGTATGSITLTNTVSGPGQLALTAPNSSSNQGQLVLNGANTYAGGTLVRGGTLVLSGAAATLGTGNVTVDNTTSSSSTATLSIMAGVANAIDDGATLSLKGGTAGSAFLDTGVNETVGGLVLNGVVQVPGTYGSTSSGALNQSDVYFSGPGVIVVPVPEPAGILAACGLVAGGLGWRRRRAAVR